MTIFSDFVSIGCPLLTVPHGILSSADTRHCNNVKISCIQDYNLIGESALTCCNGTWNAAPPTCHKGAYSVSFIWKSSN